MEGDSVINPDLIISHKFPETTYTYNERDAALYALGVGACARDALDGTERKYLYHQDGQQFIQVLPTFAALFSLGFTSQIAELPGLPYDPRLLLHGKQYIEIYKPLLSNCCIQNKASVVGLHDKGKATILEIEVVSYGKETGEPLCMNRMAVYLRGAGGFSKSSQPYSFSKYLTNTASKTPKSQPFAVYDECTQPSQPILHGLCTLGFAVRAIIKCICKGDGNLIKSISGQFLLHVYPGETLVTEMWLEGLRVLYQVKVKERNKAVLSGFVDLTCLSSSL